MMLPNDDLARWGEPPADDSELAMAELLAEYLEHDLKGEPVPEQTASWVQQTSPARDLLEASTWIDALIGTVIEHAGVLDHFPPPADAGGAGKPHAAPVELRLCVSRLLPSGAYRPVASTHRGGMAVRDLRRVPDDPDRVVLRTGDRVRLEVVCDRAGYLTVFNIGPAGNLNLLYPEDPAKAAALRPAAPVLIADVELTPPAGHERLYAVWSRQPVGMSQLSSLVQRGATLRDMKRVQETLTQLRPEDWHAVMLELQHQA